MEGGEGRGWVEGIVMVNGNNSFGRKEEDVTVGSLVRHGKGHSQIGILEHIQTKIQSAVHCIELDVS